MKFTKEERLEDGRKIYASGLSNLKVICIYYELTIYVDLWNNEMISHSIPSKRGNHMTYISGL